MIYEIYTRIMVGLPLAPNELEGMLRGFHTKVGVAPNATTKDVYDALLLDAPKHKLNDPDRQRYELALEAYIDERWEVDFAISGMSDGGFDLKQCQLWVGVRVEQWEETKRIDSPIAFVRPRVLRKGDLSMGSDLAHELGPNVHKEFVHATKMFRRARLMIEGDTITRTKKVPTSRQHEMAWVMLRWLVPVKG
jgi:hypothetical protein